MALLPTTIFQSGRTVEPIDGSLIQVRLDVPVDLIHAWEDYLKLNRLAYGLEDATFPTLFRALTRQHWPELAALAKVASEKILHGGGVAVIEGLPLFECLDMNRLLFLSLCLLVGDPMAHDAHGKRLIWEIAPKTEQKEYPTFSETATEAGLHTDGVYKSTPPSIVALHMLAPAEVGGESVWLDGREAVSAIARSVEDQAALAVLATHFTIRVPTSYGRDPKKPEFISAPVIQTDPVRLRYRHDTILAGLEYQWGMESAQHLALRHFDRILNQQPVTRYRMPAGSMVLFDNTRILHGRTAFQGPRLAQRVWLK